MQEPHPLWQHLPPERRNRWERVALRCRRLLARLQGRRERVVVVSGLYVLIWLIPLAFGQVLITVFALLPLVLVPPVGLLVYWLVWREFHGRG
mgnify:FL=1